MIRDIFNIYRDAFRQWVRTKTRPKSVMEAEEKRLFWSKCYLFSVTCAVGIYLFQLYKQNANSGDKTILMAKRLAKSMSEDKSVRILKYSGFTQVSDQTISVKDLREDNNNNEHLHQ